MSTLARILTIHTGRVQTLGGDGDHAESWTSAIRKVKASGAVQVQQTGIVGDQQADLVHHGGPDKAILAYAAQHYDRWNAEFPDKSFDAGGFGENLTVADLDESQCCIGDTFIAFWRSHNLASRAGNCRGGGTCPSWLYLCSKTAEPVGISVS